MKTHRRWSWMSITWPLVALTWVAAALVVSAAAADVTINFQAADPGDGGLPRGYLLDLGEAFGDRGSGFPYGWNVGNTGNRRNRHAGDFDWSADDLAAFKVCVRQRHDCAQGPEQSEQYEADAGGPSDSCSTRNGKGGGGEKARSKCPDRNHEEYGDPLREFFG